MFEDLGSLSDVTVLTEVKFVFTAAVDSTGMLIVTKAPFPVDTLTNWPTLHVTVDVVVLAPTFVLTEQLDPPTGDVVHPFRVQLTNPKVAVGLPFRTLFGTVNTVVITTLLAVAELRLMAPG